MTPFPLLRFNNFVIVCSIAALIPLASIAEGKDVSITYEFYDNFEYKGSPTAHGWVYQFGAKDTNFFTTEEVAQAGSKSLKGDSKNDGRVGIRIDCRKNKLGSMLSPQNIVSFSVWFFDPYIEDENEKSSQFYYHFDFINNKGIFASITFSASSYKYSYSKKYSWETIDVRSNGWHELKFVVENNQLDIFFTPPT